MYFIKQQKLFVICFIILLIISVLQLYAFLIDGAVWAEEITNFFHNVYTERNIFHILKATDAGYLPLFPRIISIVASLFKVPYEFIPYFYNWSYILITCLLLSWFCNDKYKTVIYSDKLRFFLILSVYLTSSIEVRTFINIAYLLYFVALYQVLYFFTKKAKFDCFMILLPIILASKSHLLVFFPILLYLAFVTEGKIRVIVIVSIIFLLLQAYTIITQFLSGTMTHYVSSDVSLFQKLLDTVKFEIHYFASFFFPYIRSNILLVIIGACINIFIIVSLLLVFKSNFINSITKKQIFFSFVIVIMSLFFICYASYGPIFQTNVHLFAIGRLVLTLNISLLMFSFLLFNLLYDRKLILLVLFFAFFSILSQIFSTSNFYYEYISDWKNESKELKNNEFFINIDPFPWAYMKGKRMSFNNVENYYGNGIPLVINNDGLYERKFLLEQGVKKIDNIQTIGLLYRGNLDKELDCQITYHDNVIFSGISKRINTLSSVGMIKLNFVNSYYSNSTDINIFQNDLTLVCNQNINFIASKNSSYILGMFFISSYSNHLSYITNVNNTNISPFGSIQGTQVCNNINFEKPYPRGIDLFMLTYTKNFEKESNDKEILLKIYDHQDILVTSHKKLNEVKDNSYVLFTFDKPIEVGNYKICLDASLLDKDDSLSFYTQNGKDFLYHLF